MTDRDESMEPEEYAELEDFQPKSPCCAADLTADALPDTTDCAAGRGTFIERTRQHVECARCGRSWFLEVEWTTYDGSENAGATVELREDNDA